MISQLLVFICICIFSKIYAGGKVWKLPATLCVCWLVFGTRYIYIPTRRSGGVFFFFTKRSQKKITVSCEFDRLSWLILNFGLRAISGLKTLQLDRYIATAAAWFMFFFFFFHESSYNTHIRIPVHHYFFIFLFGQGDTPKHN